MNHNDKTFVKLILNIRINLPSSKAFYYLYFTLKYFSLILATQNLRGFESKKYKITSVYSILSKLLLFDSSFSIISNYYQYICIVLLVFLVSFCLYFFYIFIKLKKVNKSKIKEDKIQLNKFLGQGKYIKEELKLFTYILIIISSINQFLEEYLFFGIVIKFIDENNIKATDSHISSFISTQIIINKTIIMAFNIISFLICILIDFFIFYLNDTKGFLSNNAIDINSNNPIKIISLILTLYQPALGFTYLYEGDKNNIYRLIICISAVFFCSIYLLLSIRRFNFYFDSQIPLFILFIICFSWCGGIFEIIMYNYNKGENYMNQKYYLIKFFVSAIISNLLFFFITIFNIRFFSMKLSLNLFKVEEKNRYPSEIYLFFKLFYSYRKDPSNIGLYKMLYFHKENCQSKECFCHFIEKNLNLKQFQNTLKKEQYAIIGEQEIVNRINYLFKMKRFNKQLENYIILHCQYIFSIRNREYYALYLCSMYLNCNLKLRNSTKYFLYEIKKEILFRIQSETNITKGDFFIPNTVNVEKNLYHQIKDMKKFTRFAMFSDVIKYLIKESFIHLENVLSFRKIITKSKIGKMNQKSFHNFLKMCHKIKINDEYIKTTILNYTKTRDQDDRIKNNEINYIISNYYHLIHKHIPEAISNKLNLKINYFTLIKNLTQDFTEFDLDYPLVLSQNKSDNFFVIYCNDYLCNYLNYSQDEIKNKDFQDLIPFDIRKEHLTFLKQFSIIQNGKFNSSNTFILSKEGCLINISLHSKILPTLYSFVYIINDIKIIENKDKSSITYCVFLDKNGYFLNICKYFEQNFFFDIKRIKQLNIKFHEFFGITPLEQKSENKKKKSIYFVNKAHSIFLTVPNDKIFYLRKIKDKIKLYQNKKYHFSNFILKNNVFAGINNINIILDEKGLDNEWYNRTKCLIERFNFSKQSKDLKSSFSKRQIKKKGISRISNDKDILFFLDYYLKKIGDKSYYIVKMIEKVNTIQLKESTKTLYNILRKSNKKLVHLNTVQFQTKRSDNSQQPLIRSNTNSVVQSPIETLKRGNLIKNLDVNDSNLNISKTNININMNNFNTNINNSINNNNSINEIANSSISLSFNNSLFNSKLGLIDDSKRGLSGINLIQNFANQEIKRTNPISNSISRNSFFSKKKPHNPNYLLLRKTRLQRQFVSNYHFFLSIAFGVVFVLSLILMILKNKKMSEHKNLFQFNVYIEILKTDAYLSSLNSLTLCFQTFFKTITINTTNFIYPKLLSLNDDLSQFYTYLDKIKGNNKLSILYDSLYSDYIFTIIEKNWDIAERNSTILEEINLILYYLYQIYNEAENIKCDYMILYNKTFKNYNKDNFPPSHLESFSLYGMFNTLQNYKNIFETITTNSTQILIHYYKSNFEFVCIYGFFILIFTIFCYLIIFSKLSIDKSDIKKLLIYIFDIGENNINQLLFENRVYHLRLLCENFIEINITKYEIIKNKNPHSDTKISKNSKKSKKSLKSSRHKTNEIEEKNNQDPEEIKKNIFLPKSVFFSYIILSLSLISISESSLLLTVFGL